MKETLEQLTKISLEISSKLGEIEQSIVLLRSKEQQLNLTIQKLLDERIKELQEFNNYAKEEEEKDRYCNEQQDLFNESRSA
jgi:hypothetical protein|tara:strand:+ start:3112 stop:3357 length:246 start_codon:yes stop_codon:yes gene_type:complete